MTHAFFSYASIWLSAGIDHITIAWSLRNKPTNKI